MFYKKKISVKKVVDSLDIIHKKEKIKDLVDEIEMVFRNVHRDNIVQCNITGNNKVKELRELLNLGEYEDPMEKRRDRVLKEWNKDGLYGFLRKD